jgi:hypothetical protein
MTNLILLVWWYEGIGLLATTGTLLALDLYFCVKYGIVVTKNALDELYGTEEEVTLKQIGRMALMWPYVLPRWAKSHCTKMNNYIRNHCCEDRAQ